MAYCKVCHTMIEAHKTEIVRRAKSLKHIKLMKDIDFNKDLKKVVQASTTGLNIILSELKLAGQ